MLLVLEIHPQRLLRKTVQHDPDVTIFLGHSYILEMMSIHVSFFLGDLNQRWCSRIGSELPVNNARDSDESILVELLASKFIEQCLAYCFEHPIWRDPQAGEGCIFTVSILWIQSGTKGLTTAGQLPGDAE